MGLDKYFAEQYYQLPLPPNAGYHLHAKDWREES